MPVRLSPDMLEQVKATVEADDRSASRSPLVLGSRRLEASDLSWTCVQDFNHSAVVIGPCGSGRRQHV